MKDSPASIFIKRISMISGIKHFIFMREDARIFTHNLEIEDIEALSSMVVFCGIAGMDLEPDMGVSRLKYLLMERKNKEQFIIFPVKNYFLGIFMHEDTHIPTLVDNVKQFINNLKIKS